MSNIHLWKRLCHQNCLNWATNLTRSMTWALSKNVIYQNSELLLGIDELFNCQLYLAKHFNSSVANKNWWLMKGLGLTTGQQLWGKITWMGFKIAEEGSKKTESESTPTESSETHDDSMQHRALQCCWSCQVVHPQRSVSDHCSMENWTVRLESEMQFWSQCVD